MKSENHKKRDFSKKKDFKKKDFKNDKAKKKLFCKNSYSNQHTELNEVMTGFLITCDRNKEKNAIRESYQIIESHIERMYPEVSAQQDRLTEQFIEQNIEQKDYHAEKHKQPQHEDQNLNNEKSMHESQIPVHHNQDNELKEERNQQTQLSEESEEDDQQHENPEEIEQKISVQSQEQKQSKEQNMVNPKDKRKRFIRAGHIKMLQTFDTRVNCLVFIKLNRKTYPQLDVDQIGKEIMTTVYDYKEKVSRCCYKFVPIKYVFKASMEDFKHYAQILIKQYFSEFKDKPVAWFLWFKARYTDKVTRSDVLNELQACMDPLHYNDFREPDLVFFVEVNGAIMYMNVLKDHKKYNEYSIRGMSNNDPHDPNVKRREEKPRVSLLEVDDFKQTDFFENQDVELI